MGRSYFNINKLLSISFAAILITCLVASLFITSVFADDAGYALRFDGTSDYVELDTTPTIIGSGWATTKSVALWVKPDGPQSDCAITADPNNATECDSILGDHPTYWGITIGHLDGPDENKIWVWNYDESAPANLDLIGIDYTPGEWIHIALVHSNGMLRAYKGGVLVGSTPSGPTKDSPGTLNIGGVVYNSSRYYLFQGDIDEVSIWNRALSASEISANMYQDWPTNDTGLAAFYRMSDGSPSILLSDDSPNDNTGILKDGKPGILPPQNGPPLWVDSTAFDVTGPSVTINQAVGQADPTSSSPINFTVVFAEAVNDFTTGDVSLGGTANPTTAIVTPTDSTHYNVAVSGMTNSGTVEATIDIGVAHNSLGEPNQASTSTDNTVTFETSANGPTVTITLANGQAATTSTSPINFTVEFSQNVTDFATGDVSLSGTAGATTAIVTGSGDTYNVAVSGMHVEGTVIATVPPGVAHGAGNFPNSHSTSPPPGNTVIYEDNTGPGVTINQAPGQRDPAPTPPIRFRVIFSEPVDDFGTDDLNLSAGSAPGALYAAVFGSGSEYDVEVSGMTGVGTVRASINAGVASDATGNPNTASTSVDNTVMFINSPFSIYLPITVR